MDDNQLIELFLDDNTYSITSMTYDMTCNEKEDSTNENPQYEVSFFLNLCFRKDSIDQNILDWALIKPYEAKKGIIKIFEKKTKKVIKEIVFENTTLRSYTDYDDIYEPNRVHAPSIFNFYCKKFEIKVFK